MTSDNICKMYFLTRSALFVIFIDPGGFFVGERSVVFLQLEEVFSKSGISGTGDHRGWSRV